MITEQEFNKIFASNLNYYLSLYNKTQAELAKYVGVSTASVSNWCKGVKLPRMDKVDKMCSFFHIQRNDLMLDHAAIHSDNEISPITSGTILSQDESELIEDYRLLNNTGKEKARDYVSDLTGNDKYTKDTGSLRKQA